MPSSVSWSPPAQWVTVVGGAFLQGSTLNMDLASGDPLTVGGMIFDATLDQDLRFVTVGGEQRIMDGPVIATALLRYSASRAVGAGPWVVELGFVPEAAVTNYTAVLLPWSRNEISLGTFDLGAVPVLPDVLQVTLTPASVPFTEVRAHVTSRSTWSGRLALSIRQTSGSNLQLRAPDSSPVELLTTQELFFTGLAGGPTGPRIRAVRDGRFAMPAFNTELIRDGDQPNLWVRPSDWDPEDEPARYRPRPGEGTVDDDIPNL